MLRRRKLVVTFLPYQEPRDESLDERESQIWWEEREKQKPWWYEKYRLVKVCDCGRRHLEIIEHAELPSDSWIALHECEKCHNKTVYYHEG